MNTYLLISGLIATFTVAGHCTLGRKWYFLPMLATDFDPSAHRIMQFVWHLATISLALPPVVLLYAAQYGDRISTGLIWYIALQYGLAGIVHLRLVTTSGIPGAVYKLFQWALCLSIAITAYLGTL